MSCILYCVCNVRVPLLVTLSNSHLSGLKDISHLASHCCVQIFLEYDGIMLSIFRPVEQAVIGKHTDVR